MKTGIKILAISAIIVVLFLGVFTLYNLPEQKESGVNIDYDIVCLQGLENISGIEHVKVNGTIWNTGQKNANNVSVTVIYTDIAHNKVVRNTPIEGAELLSGGMHYINFESKYLREFVLPKTVMDPSILIEWEEDGKLKTLTVKEGVRSTEEINVNPSLTIIENVELSEDEKVKLSNLIENIPEEVKQEFNTKYRAWNETWDEPNLAYASNPRMFTQSRQYEEFLSFCQEHDKTIWPLLFQKYEQGDNFVNMPILDLTYTEYGPLLDEIRQESTKERYTAEGAYIAPRARSNVMKYIKKLLALI